MKRFLLLLLLVAAPTFAQTPPPSATAASTPVVETPSPATANMDAASATRAWLDTMPAAERQRSDHYFEGGYWLILWNFLLSSAIALFLLATRISAKLRDFAERRTRWKWLQVAFYAIPFIFLVAALNFPLDVYQNFFREHQYGMATQNFQQWFGDWAKGFGLALVLGTLFLLALYAVFRRAPQRWWIIAALVSIAFVVLGALIAPLYIEPMFNKYTPLTDAKIRDPILQLARANEIPVTKVFVVDASRQTKRVSANVSGLGGTARIALNDNLLKECTLPEIRAVMAHEMGHYVLNHVIKSLAFNLIIFLFTFGLAKVLFDWAVRKWGAPWGVRGIADPAGLPLFVLIIGVLGFFGTPLNNTLIRVQEREADAFGLNSAREPDGMAKVALKLGAYRKMEPTSLEEFVFFDHPSGRSRIRMAMDWKAAHLPAGSSAPAVPQQ